MKLMAGARNLLCSCLLLILCGSLHISPSRRYYRRNFPSNTGATSFISACGRRTFPTTFSTTLAATSSSFQESRSTGNDDDDEEELKREALDLLDCLTSPRDDDDPDYNVEKDVRRDELLAQK